MLGLRTTRSSSSCHYHSSPIIFFFFFFWSFVSIRLIQSRCFRFLELMSTRRHHHPHISLSFTLSHVSVKRIDSMSSPLRSHMLCTHVPFSLFLPSSFVSLFPSLSIYPSIYLSLYLYLSLSISISLSLF